MRGRKKGGWLARATILIGMLAAAGPARAQWDLSSDVTLREYWSQNTTFTAKPGNGDAITSVRLSARALLKGRRLHFDGTYSPDAQFYRDSAEFNRVSQEARMTGSLDMTERSLLTFGGWFTYTPNQGVSPETIQSPQALTHFTDRRLSTLNVGYRYSLSEKNDVGIDVHNYLQLFSDPYLVDSVGNAASVHLTHKSSVSTSFDVGAANSWNRFRNAFDVYVPSQIFPNTTIHFVKENYQDAQVKTLFTGINKKIGGRTTATGRIGYNLATPGDPTKPERRGLHAQATINRSGPRLQAAAGFTRDFTSGNGVLQLSETRTIYVSTGFNFTQSLTGTLLYNRTISQRVGSGGSEEADTINGTAQLRAKLGRRLEGFASFTRYIQSTQNLLLNAPVRSQPPPDQAHNTYSIGLTTRFD